MAEIVNLRRVRKAQARTEREAQAAENRVRFGRSKAERAKDRAQAGLSERLLDGRRLTGDDSETGILTRSLSIAGHRTSISLEAPFWEALKQIAAERGVSVQALVGAIDAGRGGRNLSSAIRVFVLKAVCASDKGVAPSAESTEPRQPPG